MSDVQPILEDLQIIFKSAIGPSSEPITLSAGTIKHLCERIAKAEAECNRLGQGQILLADEVAELEAENARLKAPVSTRLEIEVSVSGLLKKHQIYGAPVPVDRVAIEEGLPIIEHALQGEVSGALISSNGVSAIAVNSAHHMKRRRFTIAHELAHYLLGHKGDQDHIDWKFTVLRRDGKSSEASDVQEIEANSFAANLLMPREFLFKDLKLQAGSNGEVELSDLQLSALARKYQVSETAMSFRLINLGLISPI